MNREERLYLVAYDIGDARRWRQIFKLMHGYGEWVQLSVFQCRLSRQRHAEMVMLLDGMIVQGEDHLITIDIGPADLVKPRLTSLGKTFAPVIKEPVIV
ncbi:MAG: CRISPR-associated endonuclease Cas2 [Rhodocyclaceae bacterium]